MKKLLLVGLAVVAMAAPAQAGITTNSGVSNADFWSGTFTISANNGGEFDFESFAPFQHLSGFAMSGNKIGGGGASASFLNVTGDGGAFNFFDAQAPSGQNRGLVQHTGSFTSQSNPSYTVEYIFDVQYLGQSQQDWSGTYQFVAAVPEPATMGFLAVVGACFGGGALLRRRKQKNQPAEETTAA